MNMPIRGQVDTGLEAWVSLQIADNDGRFRSTEAVIDTGFNGFLTLPRNLVESLGFCRRRITEVILANRVKASLNVWLAQILWHERVLTVQILEAEGVPLLGTRLLAGSQLTAQFRNGGEVLIEELR